MGAVGLHRAQGVGGGDAAAEPGCRPCERCSREALKEGAWGRALERQVEAQGWLEELAREQPELAQESWQIHALQLHDFLDQLLAPLLDSATAERAELMWATHELLEAYRHLPLAPPEWLPALEVHGDN